MIGKGVIMRDSFVFYRSFFEALQDVPIEERACIYDAICDYSLNDIEPKLTGMQLAIFKLIRPNIDSNKRKYENGKKGAVFGKKGGRPKKDNPNQTPTKPQDNPNQTRNVDVDDDVAVNVNDNVNVSTEVDIKENTIVSKKDELSLSSPSEEFIKFNQWLDKHCPFVLKVKTQMTEPEYQKLLAKYTKKEISDVLESLNNWKDFPKKRTNVYRSTLDELKKKFGER